MAAFMSSGNSGPLSARHRLNLALAAAIAFAPFKLSGAWVAFDDHTRGPGTGLNVSTYNLRLSGGGPLTNQTTGTALPVWVQVTALGAPASVQYGASPNPGTPAYQVFNGMVDFDTKGSLDNSALLYASSSQSITLTFNNLDPTKRYSFRGTSNRGGIDDGTAANNFHRRWTVCSLEGAISFTDAHSTGCVTSATLRLSGLAAGQAAYNSGMNTTTGDVVGWDGIVPSPSGSFSIVQTQYLGPIWGGDTANTTNFPGYAITGFRLEEVFDHITVTTNGPPSVTLTSPVDGSSFPAYAPLTVSAVVSNIAGLAKVEFYSDTGKIGQAASSPYEVSWAGLSAGTNLVWALATDDLGFTTTSTVARITLTNTAAEPGTVYLVIGSDTAIWNDGSTVDVFDRHPYYPLGMFTDPASPIYTVMDPAWRNQAKDSFGQPVKFTWWMMGGNIYRDAANLNVPVNNTMTLHLMKQTQGAAIRQFGDELSLHYHTFIWSDYQGNGNFLWNQAQTFEECRADFDYTLAQYLLEEEVFPVSFRSGWHYMDNDWQQYLDRLLPYSMHDNWPAVRAWFTNGPINNVQDWSRAPDVFIPFHPATNDYQVPGNGTGWNVRSIKMQSMAQRDMNSIFALASNGVDQVACIWDHLPEDFVANFERVGGYARVAASNYPTVSFRYCTAVEAMRRWRKLAEEEPPQIEVSETVQGQALTLSIRSSKALFQPQPIVALRDAFGQYTNLTAYCVATGTNAWTVALPVPRNTLAKIGIAATDLAGNVATRILRYLPDDVYIDNLDSGYAELQGAWFSMSNSAWGTDARVALLGSNDTARVKWTLPVSRSGLYQLSIQTPPLTNGAGNVSFAVWSGASHVSSAAFPEAWPGGQWVSLGQALLDQTQPNWVEMTVSGANQPGTWAVADVLRLVPLPDTDAPIIACDHDIVINCVNTNAIPVTFDLAVSDTGDPHPTIACEPPSGDLFPVGTTPVRCLATDASGNSSACTFSVIVRAGAPPSILLLTNVSLLVEADCQVVLPDLTDANHIVAADPCGPVTVTQSIPAGTALGVGAWPVVLSVFDAFGKTAYATNYAFVLDAQAPVISQQPLNRTNLPGSDAVFGVGAVSCGPILYQWSFGTNVLAGETNAVLKLSNVQASSAGTYAVTLVNSAGSITSAPAALTVTLPCCPPPQNHLAVFATPDGILLFYSGNPGRPCDIQRSTNPATGWTTLDSLTVPADGLLEYYDMSPLLEAAFYRIALP